MSFNEKSYKGHLLMVLAYTMFGLNIPAVKSIVGVGGITGLSVTFYRMAGAAVLFWIASIFAARQRVPLRDVGAIFVASLFCILLNQTSFIVGVSLTSPIDASVITTIGPMITMVLAAIFLREPITWMKAVGVFVGASGALMLILGGGAAAGRGGASVAGDLLCVASSLSFAIYLTAFKRLFMTYSAVTLMKWMFLFSALLSFPLCIADVRAVDYAALGWDVWATIAFIVVGATFTTFFLLPIGQRLLRPTVISMYNYLQPTVAAVVAVAVGMDTFGLTKGLASLLVFAGVWIVTQSKSRSQLDASSKSSKRSR
ncbi:MAG: DMT family transporter [Alistipes sp.]|jgi:drug/metabolite transporter (DMT)-like permease|nr:DMT family transporter [Alistipes sp.]